MTRICRHCSSPLGPGIRLCRACGAVNDIPDLDWIECEHHPTEPAVGSCVVCGKPMCGDCARSAEGLFFCEDPEHRSIFLGWTIVYEADSVFEADMISKNLEQAGFAVRQFDKHRHNGTAWITERLGVPVRIQRNRAEEALQLLRSMRLLDDTNKPEG